MTTNLTLTTYLESLNCSDSQQGIWVNPENIDEYRIGQFIFENGGLLDDWVCIGHLDNLSFGFQSTHDAIKNYLESCNGEVDYKGKKARVNINGILDAYSSGCLDDEFCKFLESQAKDIEKTWSHEEAQFFVMNQIPDILEQAKQDKEQAALMYS